MNFKKVNIVFEDEWILVVDKPAGLVVNRSETNKEGTLQDELSDYIKLGLGLGIGDRAGIVHRLDRETSGLLVVAKTQKAFEDLQEQFKNRRVEKEYIALVHGKISGKEGSVEAKIARIGKFGKFGVIDSRSEGREAKTDFVLISRHDLNEQTLKRFLSEGFYLTKSRINYLKQNAKEYTLLRVLPKTGRTHQIRVHLKYIGHPVVADLIYGPAKLIKFDLLWCPRLFLHASKLEIVHPKTKKRLSFDSHLPKDLKHAILNLEIV